MQSQIIENLGPVLTGYNLTEATGPEEERIGEMLSGFATFKMYTSYRLVEAVSMTRGHERAYLCLLALTDTIKQARSPLAERHITDLELHGLAFLKKDYGRMYIKPETFTDKLLDLLTRSDVDFDFDPEFSRKYYVVSNDKDSLRYKITPRFLQTIRKYDGLEIEIEGKALIVRLAKPFSVETGMQIAGFVADIVSV